MGYNPTIASPDDDVRIRRRERAVQAEADNVSMPDLLDWIANDPMAQDRLEMFLQAIRSKPTIETIDLSMFLDRQAEARAERRVKS